MGKKGICSLEPAACSRGSVWKTSGGFSFIELMIVMSLMGLFLGTVQETLIVGLRAVQAASNREAVRQRLTGAVDRLIRDISVAEDVDVAESARFQFDTPAVNDVDYVYSAGTLSRADVSSPQVNLLTGITAFDFNYFDTTGAQLSEPVSDSAEDTIRVVQVLVTVTQNSESITIASAAYLRNI